MPAAAVASLAKKAGISADEAEKRWDKAKERAEEQGRKDDFRYIMGIFKNMLGLGEGQLTPAEANRMMEATVSAAVPMMPQPLAGLGPFSEAERKEVVKRLQSLFPNATEDAIQQAVFGGPRQSLSG